VWYSRACNEDARISLAAVLTATTTKTIIATCTGAYENKLSSSGFGSISN